MSEPERSQSEDGNPYLRLLIEADLYRLRSEFWDLSVDDVMSVLNASDDGPTLPVEACYRSSRGIIARQTSSLVRHDSFGLTWIIGPNLKCEVWIPISLHSSAYGLSNYSTFHRFKTLLNTSTATNAKILDLSQLARILAAICNKYHRLLEKNDTPKSEFHSKIILKDVWRTIPFINSSIILARMERHGLPLSLTSGTMVPRGTNADSFQKVELLDQDQILELKHMGPTLGILDMICVALGVQGFFPDSSNDESIQLIKELFNVEQNTQECSDEKGRSKPET